jgi:hypothetical protein
MTVTTAWARVEAKQHYPSDVLASTVESLPGCLDPGGKGIVSLPKPQPTPSLGSFAIFLGLSQAGIFGRNKSVPYS